MEGKLIFLKRTGSIVTEKKTKEGYEDEGYTIKLKVYPLKKTGDEVWVYYGGLKVVKGALKISESITGEVGCK